MLGCNGSARAPFAIELVSAAGASPVVGATTGRLRVIVAQEGQPTRDQGVDLAVGSFELDVTIASYAAPTRIGVELVTDGVTSLGAVPAFAPIGFGFVRIPVVPAGSCATLATQRLATPRSGAALVSVQSLLVAVGGLGMDTTPAAPVERFWAPLLTATEGSGPALSTELPIGRARGARFTGQERVLVVAAARTLVLDFDPETASMVRDLAGLHAGLGERSAIAELGGNGIAVVGGASGADGIDSVSWIAIDLSVTTSALPDPRRDAAAVSWGAADGVLVAGGNGAGEPTFLYVPTAAASRESVIAFGADDEPERVLRGGALLRSPDGSAALFVGGIDETGAVTSDTWLVTGCPSRCAVSPGPTWDAPRERPSITSTSTAGWIVGGRDVDGPSTRIDRVEWVGANPTFAAASLVTARDEPAVTPLAGGLVLVAGGRGADRALDDLELCAPRVLGPI